MFTGRPGWPDVSPPGPHQTQRAWEGPSLLCVVSPEAFGDALIGRPLVLVGRILYLGTGESRFRSFHGRLLHVGQVTWISPVLRKFPKLARVLRLRLCTDVKVSYSELRTPVTYLLSNKTCRVLHPGQT